MTTRPPRCMISLVSRESKNRQRDIWRGHAGEHDVRFLAALDSMRMAPVLNPAIFRQERADHWRSFLEANQRPEAGVVVARYGGLYIGYLAVSMEAIMSDRQVGPDALYVNPRYEQTMVSELLLSFANVSVRPADGSMEAPGLAPEPRPDILASA